jgi:hypothetical protein
MIAENKVEGKMARPKSKDPKSEYITIRITEDLRGRFDTLHERSYSSLEKQQFAGLLILKGIERLERLEKLELEADETTNSEMPNEVDTSLSKAAGDK